MGLFNFNSKKKNKGPNINTATNVGTGDTSKYDELLNKKRAETSEYNKLLNEAINKTLEVLNERPEIEAVTKQTLQGCIDYEISKTSKFINQDSQLLEKAIFQEWAEENDISSDKSYESSYTNLSLEQIRSLEKYVSDKCEKLKNQKLNNSKEETFQKDEQQEQTQTEQQNTDKVDSPIPTENPIVPDEKNINEETTKIDLNEIYKELNTTKEELYLQWKKNDSISSHDCMKFEEWVIKYYNYEVEKENRQKKLNEIYKELNTTKEELMFKWSNEVYFPSIKNDYNNYIGFEEWVIEYYNNYKDNVEKKPRSR